MVDNIKNVDHSWLHRAINYWLSNLEGWFLKVYIEIISYLILSLFHTWIYNYDPH